jgi:hypothetical protein
MTMISKSLVIPASATGLQARAGKQAKDWQPAIRPGRLLLWVEEEMTTMAPAFFMASAGPQAEPGRLPTWPRAFAESYNGLG